MFSAVTAFAKSDPDNPNGTHDGLFNNPGHHYGQTKHHPAPPPGPQPTPAPTSNPNPATGNSPAARLAGGNQGGTVHFGISLTIPGADLAGKSLNDAARLGQAAAWTPQSGLEWLILMILPLLLAVWVIVAARMVDNALRRVRRVPAPVAAAAVT